MNDKTRKQIADRWSTDKTADQKVRWWQREEVIKHINGRVCGREIRGFSKGLTEKLKELPLKFPLQKGVSVGCGVGKKEMLLIREGLVKGFDLFELSDTRIEKGIKLAAQWGLQDKVNFVLGDAFNLVKKGNLYDLVHWNHSLHHMSNVDMAVEWSHRVLKNGGVFYMDDFIGPDRFQWSDAALNVASKIRNALSIEFLKDPSNHTKSIPTKVLRPSPESIIKQDPSEAGDSSRIISSLTKYFPNADITFTGGVVYQLTLSSGILNNLDGEEGKQILKLLLIIDDLCSDAGLNHFAAALAIKTNDR